MGHMTYARLRQQYRKNADQMAQMLTSGRYHGATVEQLTACHARAARCSDMTDAELSRHLSECRENTSVELARMLAQ